MPNTATAGGMGFTMTVNGSNFTGGAVATGTHYPHHDDDCRGNPAHGHDRRCGHRYRRYYSGLYEESRRNGYLYESGGQNSNTMNFTVK